MEYHKSFSLSLDVCVCVCAFFSLATFTFRLLNICAAHKIAVMLSVSRSRFSYRKRLVNVSGMYYTRKINSSNHPFDASYNTLLTTGSKRNNALCFSFEPIEWLSPSHIIRFSSYCPRCVSDSFFFFHFLYSTLTLSLSVTFSFIPFDSFIYSILLNIFTLTLILIALLPFAIAIAKYIDL